MEIKHVFFDLDHTLWDFETNSAKAFEYIFKKNDLKLDLDDFLTVYKPINFKYWRLFRNEEITKAELRYNRLKEVFDALGYAANNDLINKLSVDYIDNLSNYSELFEGAIEVLDYLKPKYTLHIITNGFEEVQHKKIKNSGLLAYFQTITTSESVGVKKPNPLIFEHALKIGKAEANQSIMVGDSYEADILGALNFGMRAVYCDFSNKPIKNTSAITIHKLLELKDIL